MNDRIKITRRTLRDADRVYFDMFLDDLDLDQRLTDELLKCETFADFEAMQDELSAGQWDAIEAALEGRA